MTSDSRIPTSLQEIDLAEDAERLEALASLADGDLDAERRDEILEHLDSDPEALDILAEVMALQDEVGEISFEEGERVASVGDEAESDDANDADGDPDDAEDSDGEIPGNVIRGPWGKQVLPAVAVLAAAAVALIFLAPRLLTPPAPTPQSMAAALSDIDSSKLDDLPWSPMRGGGPGAAGFEQLSPRDSFRLAVLATDLETALRTGDEDRVETLGPSFYELLDGSLISPYFAGLMKPGLSRDERLASHEELQELVLLQVDTFSYQYGVWIRAAWLAASSGRIEFFQGKSTRALDALEPPDDGSRNEIRHLQEQIEALEDEAGLETLAGDLAAIANLHAN